MSFVWRFGVPIIFIVIKKFSLSYHDILQFFEDYGFVVIRDVLTREECEATIDEMWTYIETRAFLGRRPPANASKLQGNAWVV